MICHLKCKQTQSHVSLWYMLYYFGRSQRQGVQLESVFYESINSKVFWCIGAYLYHENKNHLKSPHSTIESFGSGTIKNIHLFTHLFVKTCAPFPANVVGSKGCFRTEHVGSILWNSEELVDQTLGFKKKKIQTPQKQLAWSWGYSGIRLAYLSIRANEVSQRWSATLMPIPLLYIVWGSSLTLF